MPNLINDYPSARRGKIIVWGFLGSRPFGGMTWQVLHYVAGFRALGFDTWYVEDSSIQNMSPVDWNPIDDHSITAAFIDKQMKLIGLGDRWVFRPSRHSRECHGALDLAGLQELYRGADAVFNLCGSHWMRPDHGAVRCPVLVETDPVPNQVGVAQGSKDRIRELDQYRYLFTYAENLGQPDCGIPVKRYSWLKTRPPVCVEWWSNPGPARGDAALTTVANFNTAGQKDVEWNGKHLVWSKREEIRRFSKLPKRSVLPLEMSISHIKGPEVDDLEGDGWRVKSARVLLNPLAYRDYIRASLGEFSVAKQQYVSPRTGWFSDRSVCYLAAGRPVVIQDTGFSKFINTGEGLFGFSTHEEALGAIAMISRDYARHSAAAHAVASEHFSTERVLGDMLRQISLL